MEEKRNLNIELIRIFAMMLICLWHVNGHFLPLVSKESNQLGGLLVRIMPYITFHVNLFVLITGYFGIRHSLNGVVKTSLLVMFYAVVLGALLAVIGGTGFNWMQVLPFSGSPWWFMKVYLLLVLIAPVIECYLQHISKYGFYKLLFVVTFINVYLGWFMHDSLYNHHGYDILNFINIYLIGCWLRFGGRYIDLFKAKVHLPVILFLLCCAVRYKVQPIEAFNWYDYSSPLNLLMAASMFCIFLKIKVSQKLSGFILFFSTSAVAVYLITDYEAYYPWIASCLSQCLSWNYSPVIQLIIVLGFVSLMFVLCCLADKVRIKLTSCLENKICSNVEKLLLKKGRN